MEPRFEQFISEKKYLVNVSPATVEWYRQSLAWLASPTPDEAALKDLVVRMRTRGLRATSVNCHVRAVNSYLHWDGGRSGNCDAGCTHLRVPRLKEEQRIPETFTPDDVQKMVRWKPRGFCQTRLHCLVLMLADTGARIGEAIGLCWPDVDLDNLLLRLHGKGAKDRLVPFSFELRRHLWRWKSQQGGRGGGIVFPSNNGQRLGRRNILRDVKLLCRELGVLVPARTLHSFRHSFAVNYLRRGGSVFHLQKCLGHSSLEMTRRYANLVTADLSAVHERLSLLAR